MQQNTTKQLRRLCRGKRKYQIAQRLGITRPFFSYLFNHDNLDGLIAKIHRLAEKEKAS